MRLSGERCDGQVYVVPKDGVGHITRVTSAASAAITSEIREGVCESCLILDNGCLGVGAVERNGRLLEATKSRNIKPTKAIDYQECEVPKSHIEVTAGVIDVAGPFDANPA